MRKYLCAAGGLAILIAAASGANAAGANMAGLDPRPETLVRKVHSMREARHTLYGLGYYDIRVERASLPYSFTACKRGVRYHIHLDYYGDLVQVDEIGPCGGYGRDFDDDYYRRDRYSRYDY